MVQQTQHFHHIEEHNEHKIDWKSWAKALVMIGLGVDLALLIATDLLTYYISPHFSWLTYVAAGLFLLYGALLLLDLLTGRTGHDHAHDHEHDHNDHHHHDHDHVPMTWGIIAIVSIPVLLGILVPPEPLGASAVNGGISTASVGVADRESATRAPLERTIIDWLRQFETSDNINQFAAMPVDVVGFVYHEPGYGEQNFMLARFAISCCVADAFAIGLPVAVDDISAYGVDTWLRIRGTLQIGTFDGREVPIIQPSSIENVPMPRDPYLYT